MAHYDGLREADDHAEEERRAMSEDQKCSECGAECTYADGRACDYECGTSATKSGAEIVVVQSSKCKIRQRDQRIAALEADRIKTSKVVDVVKMIRSLPVDSLVMLHKRSSGDWRVAVWKGVG